jgi:hypothetical protein
MNLVDNEECDLVKEVYRKNIVSSMVFDAFTCGEVLVDEPSIAAKIV